MITNFINSSILLFRMGSRKLVFYQLEGSNIHRTFSLWLLRKLLQLNIFIIFAFHTAFLQLVDSNIHRTFSLWLLQNHLQSQYEKSGIEWLILRLFFCHDFDGFWYDGTAHPPRRQISPQMTSNSLTRTNICRINLKDSFATSRLYSHILQFILFYIFILFFWFLVYFFRILSVTDHFYSRKFCVGRGTIGIESLYRQSSPSWVATYVLYWPSLPFSLFDFLSILSSQADSHLSFKNFLSASSFN